MKQLQLEGVITPLVTPLTEQRDLDLNSLHTLLEHQVEAGVHGVFVLGSTGESAYLTAQQRLDVLQTSAHVVAGRIPLLAGVLECGADAAVALAQVAADAGADALVVCPPFYQTHSQSEIIAFFRYLRRHSPLPLCIYNVPVITKVQIAPATVRALVAEDLIIALKDSSNDIATLRAVSVQRTASDRLAVFTGLQDIIDLLLFMGVDGMIPGLANGLPQPFVELYAAARAGAWEQARHIQERLLPLLTLRRLGDPSLSTAAAAIGAHKTILKLKGIIRSNQMARPLPALDASTQERIAAELRAHAVL